MRHDDSTRAWAPAGRVVIRDRPAVYWALGLFLLAGSLLAVAMPLGLANNASDLSLWERLASMGIGVGGSAGALWWLGRNPATRVELDIEQRRLTVVRWGINGRNLRQFAFDDFAGFDVEQGKDSDGDPVWRPAARLRSGELVPLSCLWRHDRPAAEATCARVAASVDSSAARST